MKRFAKSPRTSAARKRARSGPPDGLPLYRVLTGPDDATFCHRVSEALALGYQLYGAPAATYNGENVILAQAIIWPSLRISIAGPP
jgi:hypothetical protein